SRDRFLAISAGGPPFAPSSFVFPNNEMRVPHPCAFCKGGPDAAASITLVMLRGLHRYYGADQLHLSRALAITAYLFCAPHEAATASSPYRFSRSYSYPRAGLTLLFLRL
ncbi:MAG: hypothetical protein WAJ97_09760, partial [Terriglobales bacterium]